MPKAATPSPIDGDNLLANRLLEWYASHARCLPWRSAPAPYRTWVSEVMLQQTQVETVIPYFERWMAQYPTLEDLAAAPLRDVLRLWEGLGYYSRARNLLQAARTIMEKYNGQIPSEIEQLQKLPGVGRYTAAAIASIAFGRDEATLDGNIRRVLSRLFAVRTLLRSTESERSLWQLARQHLPAGRASDYNQAWMDLGSMVCIPHTPRCFECPLTELCAAYQQGKQDELPLRQVRNPVPHYTVAAAVIQRDDLFLIAQRPPNGLLGGLWEFPGGKLEAGETPAQALRREINEELDVWVQVGEELGAYAHAYTHFRVTLYAYYCLLEQGEPRPLEASELRWVIPAEMKDFAMGKIDRKIAIELLKRCKSA